MDLGYILKHAEGPNDAEELLNGISEAQKVELLTNHVRPTEELKTDGKYRRFLVKWLDKYKWLVYSFVQEGAFCLPCALFASFKHIRGQLVVAPFLQWMKFT